MDTNKKNNLYYLWIIFLFSPFFAFLLAIKRGFNTYYQPIILGFSFIFGYSVYFYSGDILRYIETYEMVKYYTWNDFWFILSHPFDGNALSQYPENLVNRKPDKYALILQFIVSRFTDNYRWFFALASLIYTKFFLMFLNEVYNKMGIKPQDFLHYIFIIFLLIVVPFYVGVTGIRFWTALFLFLYFLFKYFDKGGFQTIFSAGLSLFIHYSFIVPVALLFLVHILPIKKFATKILVVISLAIFFISSTTSMLNNIQRAVSITEGTNIEENVGSYTDADLLEQRKSKSNETNWYVSLRSDSVFYLLIIFFILEFGGFLKLKDTIFTSRVYPLIVLFFCLTLLTYHLGSLGRFKNVFYLLVFSRYAIIYPVANNRKVLKSLSIILLPFLVLYILVSFRGGFYFVDAYLVINNIIGVFSLRSTESLSEFIVGH